MSALLHHVPNGLRSETFLQAPPEDGSSYSSRCQAESLGAAAAFSMVKGRSGFSCTEPPAWAPVGNPLTARPARLVSRHRPSTWALSAPARLKAIAPALPDRARRIRPSPVTDYDVVATTHELARAALAVHFDGSRRDLARDEPPPPPARRQDGRRCRLGQDARLSQPLLRACCETGESFCCWGDSFWERDVIHCVHGYAQAHPAPFRGAVAAS